MVRNAKPRRLRPPEMQGHNLFTPIGETTRRVAASHEPSPRPALPEPGDPSCVTDDCHVSIKAAKRLHGPVNVDACDVCHQLTDETEHRFALKRSDTELCTFCHEFDVSGMPKVHKPVALGQCLGCHDPHGSSRLNLTREESTVAMCGRCHGNTIDGHKSLHTPVAQGQCLACHAPHASQMPDMLDVVGTDLCLTCHDQFGEQLAAVKFTHEALEEQCTYCHDAHGASEPMALRQPIIKLCTECHEDTRQQMTAATFAHGSATQDGRACLNCHTAHGGNFKALMRSLPAVACMQCHDKSLQTPDGRIIAAASDMLDDSLVRHGPIAEGQCGGCHAPHGGQREALLTGDYSDRLRQRYSADRYALCFSCHDEKLAVQQPEDAEPATAFRNGDVNLHAVHVNDAWGRACVACHATHTAPNAKLIRPSLRVKNWEAPMVFRATPTGGYCASGCHHPLKYDRETPLPIGTQLEPTVPAVSRSQHNDRPPVRFTAMDIDGQELAVPHSERMTLIVALRSPRDDIERAVQPILAALPEQRDFELVMLVNGDDAKQAAGALAAMQDFGGRVVPDERSELTHTLNVQAWPAVVLVAPDGRERARIHGTAVTLALRLEGYLAADAQTDEPARQAAAVANGSRDTGVRQYLQLVEQWSRHGQTERALKIAREAVALHPEEPQLQAMLANALNATGRPDEALKVLDALPPDAAELVLARASRAEALMLQD